MDATGEKDIEVQRSSPDLIAELTISLPRFLRKSKVTKQATRHATRVRTLVLSSKTERLIKLLEPFQEWPQLLDPHLAGFLEPLVSAFIEYLSTHIDEYPYLPGKHISSNVIPLPRAICKILYTFCKVRGQKVVGQFLNNEPRHLERMLEALERWGQSESAGEAAAVPEHGMIWEERFIMLLWLSHLMLAPFDLVSMSSERVGPIPGASRSLQIDFPANTPAIARRLVNISNHYLDFASKEREVAALLLSRLALRSDMQRNGLQSLLVDCALMRVDGAQGNATSLSVYAVIGILSFLARLIVSAESEILQPLLASIYTSVRNYKFDNTPLHKKLNSSSVAKKLTIKINRELAVASIRIDSKNEGSDPSLGEGSLEEVIDELLTALADKDTSVRVAASKALSVVAVPLDPEMVAQIVELILERLREDIVWVDERGGKSIGPSDFPAQGITSASELSSSWTMSLAHANAMSWHGLVLTLSQLIYRGSMPSFLISKAAKTLDLALHFEQRSSLGVSVGTSVRDAACFGIWSLARKYTTAELTAEVHSTLQTMANGLIVAATLDSAGNIRRGASAALQEMIGRHPDEIKHGIELVQIIDYHAIALRSRAMLDVACKTSDIASSYWEAVLYGLLDWRGVGSVDATSRRQAAEAIGHLAIIDSPTSAINTIKILRSKLHRVSTYKIEERHGILLGLAEIVLAEVKINYDALSDDHDIDNDVSYDRDGSQYSQAIDHALTFLRETLPLWTVYCTDRPELSYDVHESKIQMKHLDSLLKSELMCEAVCSLISALAWSTTLTQDLPGEWPNVLTARPETMNVCLRVLERSLEKTKSYVLQAGAGMADKIFALLSNQIRGALISQWAERIRVMESISRSESKAGATSALAAVFKRIGDRETSSPSKHDAFAYISQDEDSRLMSPMRALIIDTLVYQLSHPGISIELKCTTLYSLTTGVLESQVITENIMKALIVCLDDYTTDQRGDVGSLVRTAAVDAVSTALKKNLLNLCDRQVLAAKVCGLAVEKLDKVRWRAWKCLQSNWDVFATGSRPSTDIFDTAQTSTSAYFLQMMSFCREEWTRVPLFNGYVTSAGSGSESVLQASREAFVAYTVGCSPSELATYCTNIVNIVQDNLSNDRLVVPTVEFLGFLFDAGVLIRLVEESFGWSRLFNLTQKTHFKTQTIHKIEAAIKIYAGMAQVPKVKDVALNKLCQTLRHPFPKARNDAADALFIVTQDEEMLTTNWSRPTKELDDVVLRVKERSGMNAESRIA